MAKSEDDYADIRADFDRALRLRDSGRIAEAEDILSRLVQQRPNLAAIHGVLGDIYDRQGKDREAVVCFRRAVALSPGSELASISLFHLLYQQGDLSGAFDEMKRFRRRGPSEEYNRLIEDLRLELPPEE
jgi:predicted Zn-dependent protease